MIIQHNMTAANANRMLGSVVTSQSKSTEKLSSGYRINRAADDAAGLSISEKMRGQIRGLEQASTNAQDGISMIQTAEGALNESHSILQRMRELSIKAATGTETDDDREAVQDEITELQEELDRISETTEFNTMKLLDGSLGGQNTTKTGKNAVAVSVGENAANGSIVNTAATKGTYNVTSGISAADDTSTVGDTTSLVVTYNDNGEDKTVTINLKYDTLTSLKSEDGERSYAATSGAATVSEKAAAFKAELQKTELNDKFDIDITSAGKITFTAKEAGSQTPKISYVQEKRVIGGAESSTSVKTIDASGNTKAADSFKSVATATLGAYDGASSSNIENNIFEVNGNKFVFVTEEGEKKLNELGYKDINYVVTAAATPDEGTNGEVTEMVNKINTVTGINAKLNATTDTTIELHPGESKSNQLGGVTLQVGANEGQTISFTIGDMSSKALGVDANKISVADQASAQKATTVIDDAIKKVSKQRSSLGAKQNRLEHTIANLDTSAENLQTAESRIRDVDMAKEMVTYSKNNILQQAAQSMLAQANQSNQGVLSLLQ